MWKEYTRETPARPWLAVVTAVIALAGTTGLAQYFTTQRAHIKVPAAQTALPGWPITFSVPKGFRFAGTTSELGGGSDTDGSEDSVVFVKESFGALEMQLDIEYATVSSGMSLDRVYRRLTNQALDDHEEMDVGTLSGVLTSRTNAKGAVVLRTVARTEEGLAIMISLVAEEDRPRTRRVLESVCQSVEFKGWVVRQR